MSSELTRQLQTASRRAGSYTQSRLEPLSALLDPYGQVGVGYMDANSVGGSSGAGTTVLTERDFNLRTFHDRQTVTNAQGVSMDITPIKSVTFEDSDGKQVKLVYANAPLQKIVP